MKENTKREVKRTRSLVLRISQPQESNMFRSISGKRSRTEQQELIQTVAMGLFKILDSIADEAVSKALGGQELDPSNLEQRPIVQMALMKSFSPMLKATVEYIKDLPVDQCIDFTEGVDNYIAQLKKLDASILDLRKADILKYAEELDTADASGNAPA